MWDDNIKRILKKEGGEVLDKIHLAQIELRRFSRLHQDVQYVSMP